MTPFKRSLQHLSLAAMLQEMQQRLQQAPSIPSDQQLTLTTLAIRLLQASVSDTEPPLPGDLAAIKEQAHVKRALEVAAAGGHNLLLVGPAGAEKALLARTLPSLLRALEESPPFGEIKGESETSSLFGDADLLGEILAAFGGVLLLLDLEQCSNLRLSTLAHIQEFQVLALGPVRLPARVQLVATLSSCPCGFRGHPQVACRCKQAALNRYARRLTERLRHCFEMRVEVFPLIEEQLVSQHPEESSAVVSSRVKIAHALQSGRYQETSHLEVNADLRSAEEVEQYCSMDADARKLLGVAIGQLHLTPSEALSLQRVARTIADLAQREMIGAFHLAEAIQSIPHL